MSIRSSFERVKVRSIHFEKKSYNDLNLGYEILDAEKFLKDPNGSDLKERIYKIEYTVDKVKEIIRLYNKKKSQVINIFEIRDFFFDVGFNVDVLMTEIFNSDITMVYNIGGYVLPFWEKIISKVFKKKPSYKRMFITALSPGKQRLHCRIYHGWDGAWYITSHVDHANWLNVLDVSGIFKSHLVRGTGDFELGTKVMKVVLDKVIELHENRKNLFININDIYENILKDNRVENSVDK